MRERCAGDGPRRSLLLAVPWRRPDERAHRRARHAAARSNGRSTPAWCGARGSSSRCRCCSRLHRRPAAAAPAADLPPAFDRSTAAQLARELARDYPDRAPGSAGALGAAAWVAEQLALYGFEPQVGPLPGDDPGPGAVRAAESRRGRARSAPSGAIVVMAHRDNSGEGAGHERQRLGHGGPDRAGARVRPGGRHDDASRRSRRTRSSSSRPTEARSAASARHVSPDARRTGDTRSPCSVSTRSRARPTPRLELAGDTPARRRPHSSAPPPSACSSRPGASPPHASALRQLLDLGFPFSSASRRRSSRRGIPAVTLTTRRTRRRRRSATTPARRRAPRRARAGRPEHDRLTGRGPRARAGNDELRLPRRADRPRLGDPARPADGAAALPRRRGRPLCALPAPADGARPGRPEPPQPDRLLGARRVLVFSRARLGVSRTARPRPPPPDAALYDGPSPVVLGVLAALLARRLARRARAADPAPAGTREEELAGPRRRARSRSALVALLVVATNPYALVFLLPSLHAWLWLPQVQRRGRARARPRSSRSGWPGRSCSLLVRDRASGSASTRRGTCSRSSRSATCPGRRSRSASSGSPSPRQLAALAAGRYAPYPEARRARAARAAPRASSRA